MVREVEFEAEGGGQGFEDAAAGGDDFAADAVSGDETWMKLLVWNCINWIVGGVIELVEGDHTYPERTCGHCEAVMCADSSHDGNFGVAPALAEYRMAGASWSRLLLGDVRPMSSTKSAYSRSDKSSFEVLALQEVHVD